MKILADGHIGQGVLKERPPSVEGENMVDLRPDSVAVTRRRPAVESFLGDFVAVWPGNLPPHDRIVAP
jgi:hypothetical protein